ncbi:hypothetical protein PUV54_08930 [Hyphococcus flavus]|uniref:Uncharacterized protein n=1 Tax=Hyphococcus flavus TaxID=1866326 RepID=A0AAE9ZBF3_9PROT|nr:hypothetical protein [Hyphococcus flavus]WDI30080.1 hypothetical protein PUV54_08930 [Hyphococcus flavus]
MKSSALFFTAFIFSVSCGQTGNSSDNESIQGEIGSSLTDKSEVTIDDLPSNVLAVAQATRPNVTFTEAEKEIRNGKTYYDVGGVDENNLEIELDIMEDGASWRVVEIQRDISFVKTPESVRTVLLEYAPGISPDRIIESDQTDGVIIYEFFTRSETGEETKHEVKLENGLAEFLEQEWEH